MNPNNQYNYPINGINTYYTQPPNTQYYTQPPYYPPTGYPPVNYVQTTYPATNYTQTTVYQPTPLISPSYTPSSISYVPAYPPVSSTYTTTTTYPPKYM